MATLPLQAIPIRRIAGQDQRKARGQSVMCCPKCGSTNLDTSGNYCMSCRSDIQAYKKNAVEKALEVLFDPKVEKILNPNTTKTIHYTGIL